MNYVPKLIPDSYPPRATPTDSISQIKQTEKQANQIRRAASSTMHAMHAAAAHTTHAPGEKAATLDGVGVGLTLRSPSFLYPAGATLAYSSRSNSNAHASPIPVSSSAALPLSLSLARPSPAVVSVSVVSSGSSSGPPGFQSTQLQSNRDQTGTTIRFNVPIAYTHEGRTIKVKRKTKKTC